MATYDIGDVVTLTCTVRDEAGALADAEAITCTITLPDGTTTSPTPAHPSTGTYTTPYTGSLEGLHGVLWVATGANAGAYRDSFTVLAATTPLLSLDDVKARLNISDTTNDEELRRISAAATARLALEARRVLASTTQTVTVDMTGLSRRVLTLPKPCWLSISSVTDNGTAVDAADWLLDETGQTLTKRIGYGVWTGEVTVTGRAGVTGDDLAIAQQAALELTAHLWETQRVPMGRNSAPGPVPGMGYALPNRVSEMIAPLCLPGGFA